MNYSTITPLSMAIVLCLSLNSDASDYEKEKRWADQIADALLDGEPHYLTADEHEFLAIHTEPASESSSGVVLLHGTGVHPDWQTVIHPLRVELAENGLHTLSIQMPVLANDAKHEDYIALFPEVSPRIEAALKFFNNQDISKVYLVGHSLGASMGVYYLANSEKSISGFIAIGLSTGLKDTNMDNLAHLSVISVPVLDLYGTEDLENVVEFAPLRKDAVNPDIPYQQTVVDGADHFFDGEETQLLDHVLDWIKNK